MYICICICICMYVYVRIYIYIYMYKDTFLLGGSQKFMRSRGLEGLGKRLGEEMVEAHHQGLHPFPLADLVGLAYDPN